MADRVASRAASAPSVDTPATITVSLLAATIVAGIWRIVAAAQGADDSAPTLVAAFVFVLTGLAFIQWLYRARLDLERRGAAGLTWRPGWAIGGWFIPIANLVIPLLVVNEIDQAGPRRPGHWIFVSWATVWTAYSIANYGFVRNRAGTGATIALTVVGITAAVCAIGLVRRITAARTA